MSHYFYQAKVWFDSRLEDSWGLIDAMNRTEWLILLSVVTLLGFLMLRGFGSRQGY